MGSRRADQRHDNKSAQSTGPLYVGRSAISKEIGRPIPRFRRPFDAAGGWWERVISCSQVNLGVSIPLRGSDSAPLRYVGWR